MTDDNPGVVRKVSCDKHGETSWQGHVLCGACGRAYQTHDADKPRFAPIVCECSIRLMPTDDDGDSVEFSACVLCFQCFRKLVKKFGGRLPSPPQPRAKA